ncbi:hypothetical protein H6F88_31365 [Oculatella sp. FACHB-28]|uniref:hypothetical protein n=1 Tax=Oculatella sp. FACHB-28 TaxID=2692845 RepID=UPI00168223DA|nr:hypothetical protein [Oculatella sp. FACHB-28]MBD2060444.1 hypothetical protein [Oculatella sp. FACHB-28]
MSDLSLSNAASTKFCRSFWRYLEKPLTGLLLTLALSPMAKGFPIVKAHGAEVPEVADRSTLDVTNILSRSTDLAQFEATNQQTLPDGTYVFGQSPEADQVGSTYLVFEANDEQIVGAFYMPTSSFDCFYGEPEVEHLELTVVNSEDQSEYAHTVELQRDTSVATVGNSAIASLHLTGYHQIDTVSPNDHRILAACKVAQQQLGRN